MIKEKHVISALPLIAAVLGRKYGVQVEIGGDSAYTDGSTIYLPSLPAYGDATLLGLAKGYVDHESAHIRDTDFAFMAKVKISPLEKHIWNIIEDYRVEHKLSSVFPGCAYNFKWLIKHLFINDSPAQQTHHTGQQILNWLLLYIRSWDVHKLSEQVDSLSMQIKTAFPGLLAQVAAIVDTIPARCHNTRDSLEMARELVKLLEQYCANMQLEEEEKKNNNNPQPADGGINTGQVSDGQRVTDIQSLQQLLVTDASALPQDMGQIVADALGKLQNNGSDKIKVARIAQKHTWELNAQQLHCARRATTALRARLQGLLQSRVFKPSRSGYRGKLDTRNLHRLTINNPKVFRQKEYRQGLDTIVHILLDASGSMHGAAMDLACQACFATAQALSPTPGVTLAVTAFPGEAIKTPTGSTRDTVAPILKPKQKMHNQFAISAGGSTPLDSALWWINAQMQFQQEKRKIILLISDGEPDNMQTAQLAIEAACKQGLELYGIGINAPSILNLLPKNSKVISGMGELPSSMFGLLQQALLT